MMSHLVYADYIEERGDADRQELIRVQIELASNGALSAEEHAELEAREHRLLEEHRKEWALKLSRGRQRFRRGFVEEIATSAESLLAYGDHLFHETPVQDLRIVAADHLVPRIATQLPGLGHAHVKFVEQLVRRHGSARLVSHFRRSYAAGIADSSQQFNLG